MNTPRFSVVMLLPDARGVAEQSVRSWSSDQDFPREQHELVVVSNGREPDVEKRIAPLLGANDRLLQLPGATRAELYDQGARAAGGEFIVFTESHCLAQPRFLRAMDRYLRQSGLPAGFTRTAGVYSNALSRLEGCCTLTSFDRYQSPEDWRKVNVHSFTLRRDLFLDAGGFLTRYGIFSEMILAEELWRRGVRAGLADAPPVWHVFDGCPREVREYNQDVVSGEMRYYRDHPHGPRIDHTYLADGDVPWPERELAQAAFAAMWAERRRSPALALRQGWRFLKLAIREGRIGRAADHVKMHLAANTIRIIGSKPACALRLFLWMWATAARLARKEYLATEPPVEYAVPVAPLYRIDEIPSRDLWGFHLLERWNGLPIRWSEPCFVMRLPRPQVESELVLQTGGVGWPIAGRKCSFHLDGKRLPAEAVQIEWNCIRLRILPAAARSPMLLAVVIDPVTREQRGADPRELGFPLLAIETRPVHAAALRAAA